LRKTVLSKTDATKEAFDAVCDGIDGAMKLTAAIKQLLRQRQIPLAARQAAQDLGPDLVSLERRLGDIHTDLM